MVQLDSKRREEQRSKEIAWSKEQLAQGIALNSQDDPTNFTRQLGKPMANQKLEALISKLNTSIQFAWHPKVSYNKRFAFVEDAGKRRTLAVYEAGLLPEFSIMGGATHKIPNPDRHEYSKKEILDDAHYITYRHPDVEVYRGWRTVLAMLVLQGMISKERLDRLTQPTTREGWHWFFSSQADTHPLYARR